jgi:hypothetical protein
MTWKGNFNGIVCEVDQTGRFGLRYSDAEAGGRDQNTGEVTRAAIVAGNE